MNIKKGDVFVRNEERLEVIKIAGNVLILSPMYELNGEGVLRFLNAAQLKEFGYRRGDEDQVGHCACGLHWGHTGKHARKECDHGTDLNYFCEDCDGAKITEGIDKENDAKKVKVECQCEASCHHHCSSNCRRVGCNCECGEWHRG